MRGVGGPLLCIGDLLSDVGESDASPPPQQHEPSPSSSSVSSSAQSLDLTKLFQVSMFYSLICFFYSLFVNCKIRLVVRWIFQM